MNKSFHETMAEVNLLRDKVKKLCMIFQLESKQDAARAFNKPIDFYYHFKFNDWNKVSKRLVKKRDRVEKESLKLGHPTNLPWNQSAHYRKQMGLDRF